MLIGVPASGKTTWLAENAADGVIVSSDNHIEEMAAERGQTYTEAFSDLVDIAATRMNRDLWHAIKNDQDIYWDQTNVGRNARAKKIAKIPEHYEKIAVFFKTPDADEHRRRLDSRPGKFIPPHVMRSMIENLAEPTEAEGFTKIIYI